MLLNIAALAKDQHKSIAGLARQTGLHVTTVRRLFYASRTGLERDQGSLSQVKLTNLQKIATELGVEVRELIANTEKGETQ